MLLGRHRIALISLCLLLSILATSLLVQRQTALLVEASAAPPRPTTPAERQLDPSQPPDAAPSADAAPASPTPTIGPEVQPPVPPRAALIDQQRYFYEPNFYALQIQAFLETQAGPLKNYRAWVGDREHSFAEILGSQTSLYSINPKIVLALIEQQSGLVSAAAPSEDQQKFMLGFRGENEQRAGWVAQVRWAIRELHRAQRDFPSNPELTYADQSHSPLPSGLSVADYGIVRVLAATTTAADLPRRLDGNDQSFVATYTRMFGDPRDPPQNWPQAAAPFLTLPMEYVHETTSFFDHDTPFLQPNATTWIFRGDQDERFSYDGHDGWDFAMLPPEPILAPADGVVVFAGNSDDGCGVARAVIIDHQNGYRTLYWHLSTPTVETGQAVRRGEQIGVVGSTGCASGPHLHFQVQHVGRDVDPAGWCGPSGGDPWANHPAGQVSTWLWRDVPSPCKLPDNAIVVDTSDPNFKRVGDGWQEFANGLGGTALSMVSTTEDSSRLAIGVWRPSLPKAGRYRVLAWLPFLYSGRDYAVETHYVIGHADGSGDAQQVDLNQWNVASGWGWADLGTHTFDPARTPFVGLSGVSDEAGNNVWYDAVMWIPID